MDVGWRATPTEAGAMTVGFVLSGGGNLGAGQAGQLRALIEAGVRPDLVVGTSVGAINGAFLVGAPDADGCRALAAMWRTVRRSDVFPARPFVGFAGFTGRRSYLVPDSGLRALLKRNLRYRNLEDSPIPLHVVACELA